MSVSANPIVETYSRLAREYDEDANFLSCWGRASERALSSIHLRDDYKLVVDMGCGTAGLFTRWLPGRRQAFNLSLSTPRKTCATSPPRKRAGQAAVQVRQGSFEQIPLETASVDYLYSILAFHWVTNLDARGRGARPRAQARRRKWICFLSAATMAASSSRRRAPSS